MHGFVVVFSHEEIVVVAQLEPQGCDLDRLVDQFGVFLGLLSWRNPGAVLYDWVGRLCDLAAVHDCGADSGFHSPTDHGAVFRATDHGEDRDGDGADCGHPSATDHW